MASYDGKKIAAINGNSVVHFMPLE